jgi:hypothetical protein
VEKTDFDNNVMYENGMVITYDVPRGCRNGLWVRFRCDADADENDDKVLLFVDNIGIIYGK